MKLTCKEIFRKGGMCDDFILKLFNAMESSDDFFFSTRAQEEEFLGRRCLKASSSQLITAAMH